MTKSLQNTQTRENLLKAFAGESMGRMRYTYYSKAAKEEGYVQISNIFLETAENEKAHAKRFFKFLGEENIPTEIKNIAYPTGLSDKTLDNLEFAAECEKEENTILYPNFAKIAKEEGFAKIAECFLETTEVEKVHEARYRALIENIKKDRVFKRDKEVIWKCSNCGYHYYGKEAPEHCPSCLHPVDYFEIYCKNF